MVFKITGGVTKFLRAQLSENSRVKPLKLKMAIPRDSSFVSKAFQKNFVALVDAIKAADPQRVGDELFTEEIVSEETLSEVELPTNTPYNKSRILVKSVRDKLKVVPEKLEVFMKILQKSIEEAAFQSK